MKKKDKNCGMSRHVLIESFFRNLFADLARLEELRLNENGLKTIHFLAFRTNGNLIKVLLRNNELTFQPTGRVCQVEVND